MTELLSLSSNTIRGESFLNVEKLLWSFHMRCEAPESMPHFGATTAPGAARAQAVNQKGSQSPVVARAAVAVAFFTFHHFFIRV